MSTLLGRYVGSNFLVKYVTVWRLHFIMWCIGLVLVSAACTLAIARLYMGAVIAMLIIGNVLVDITAWYSRERKLRIKANPLPATPDSIISTTNTVVRRYIRSEDIPTDIVGWCDTLIRKWLNRVLGRNVHIPQTLPQVIQVPAQEIPRYMDIQLHHRSAFNRVVYFPSVDTVIVGVTQDKEATLYLTLFGSLMRMTYDKFELMYLAAVLTYYSDSPQAFVYARDMMLHSPAATAYWPTYLSEPGWSNV